MGDIHFINNESRKQHETLQANDEASRIIDDLSLTTGGIAVAGAIVGGVGLYEANEAMFASGTGCFLIGALGYSVLKVAKILALQKQPKN